MTRLGSEESDCCGTARILLAVATLAQLLSASQAPGHEISQGCQVAEVVEAVRPGEGNFFVTPDEFVRFLSPARIWQRVPVVARRSDAPKLMLISFHPQRLSRNPCQVPNMVSRKWSIWIDETDAKIKPTSAEANNVYNDPAQRAHYSTNSNSPADVLLTPLVMHAASESAALLSLQSALRPFNDAIGLSAALWKDQVGSWGKPPYSAFACPTNGSPVWEAVACSDDRQSVVKLKLLGLSDSTFGSIGGGRFEGTLPAELGTLASLEELWLNIHAISGTIPASFGNLGSLRRLHLGFNSLTGSIPQQFEQLNALEFLDLQSNQLSGTVPPLSTLLQPGAKHAVPLGRRLRLGQNDGLTLPDWLVYSDVVPARSTEGVANSKASGTAKGRRARRKAERGKITGGSEDP